ncbi:MAG: DUF4065 domain-containing protein [Chloroflexi bacterium]|nr:DUF4065 domain-containing protein [Chloroflexota bacterium]
MISNVLTAMISGTGVNNMKATKAPNGKPVILRILDGLRAPVHSTKLVKLVYLVDYVYYQHFGRTLTGFTYMWDNFGPNAVGHAIIEQTQELVRERKATLDISPNIYGGTTVDFAIISPGSSLPMTPEAEMVIADILEQYGRLSVAAVTRVAKRTEPFRNGTQYTVLELKQTVPVLYGAKEEWEKFQTEIKEEGTWTLDDLKREYRLA